MRNRVLAAIVGMLCLAPGARAASAGLAGLGGWVPTGEGKGTAVYRADAPGIEEKVISNGIDFHTGGVVMHGTVHIYFIYYGTWSNNTAAQTILEDWASHIGGSPYYNINTTYYDPTGSVSNSLTFAGKASDNYSQGTSLSDTKVFAVVNSAITGGHLPLDSQGVYFVLSSADVAETSGFCSIYCGWHRFGTIGATAVKYAFVGNHDRCPSSCEGLANNSPNGNPGADGMISTMSHELEEATSDPLLNAWYDFEGNENADKCAYDYGTTYTTGNGSQANVRLGSRDYLIQRNWLNAGGGSCQIGYDPSQAFHTVPLCRAVDTRNPNGPLGGPALGAGETRGFALAGHCGIPATAKAVSVNVTVTGAALPGYITLYPGDQALPGTSVVNFAAGATRTNNSLLVLSGEGSGTLAVTNASAGALQVIVDVNGYFQ